MIKLFSLSKKSGDMAVGQVSFHNDKKVPFYLFTILYLSHPYNRSNEVFSHLSQVYRYPKELILPWIQYTLQNVKMLLLIALTKQKLNAKWITSRNASIVSSKKMPSNELLLLIRYSISKSLLSFSNSAMFPVIEKARCRIGENERSRKGCSIIRFFV